MNVHLLREDTFYSTTVDDIPGYSPEYVSPDTRSVWYSYGQNFDKTHLDRLGFILRDAILGTTILTTYFIYTLFRSISSAASIGPAVKRGIDIFASAIGLILLSPLLAVVALAIKLDSPGLVFYSQRRVGRDRRCNRYKSYRNGVVDRRCESTFGRPFRVYKFRSMRADAEKKSGPVWASENDPRITRVGAFIRRTRIDELPQLFNVLKGEMSLVGPRPERPHFVVELSRQIPDYRNRLTVKPGITGLAQVENGYDSSVDSVRKKVQYDLEYIKDWSITKDFKILLKTAIVVLTGFGAR